MAGKRHDDGRLCLCDRPDGGCVGLAVRRLSQDRVQELAEEIWAASCGDLLPARALPDAKDPRSSRAGASAQAAYRRRRGQEWASWRLGWGWWSLAVTGAALAGLLVGATLGDWLAGPAALLGAGWAGWRLRCRPSAEAVIWRRQATIQRRTASMLGPLADEGYLVLHDVTLPGWPASLEHLVVGSTGVWVIQCWRRAQPPPLHNAISPWHARGATAGPLPELRWQAAAIADMLAGGGLLPVRPLLCVPAGWPVGRRSVEGVTVATTRQLVEVIRQESPLEASEVERATTRALELLRPAA
jgi:hypothetical protein